MVKKRKGMVKKGKEKKEREDKKDNT